MAMTKAEVRRAFREAMAADYADIPAKEDIDHVFSPAFYAKMDALIAEQKRGSWRLLSRQSRRALVAAAILAASLLLVACTPKLREAVSELVVTVYETFVDFVVSPLGTEPQAEIETVYGLEPVPNGYRIVSQNSVTPYLSETVYADNIGNLITIIQSTADEAFGSKDSENGKTYVKTIEEVTVLFSSADDRYSATWSVDGYSFHMRFIGSISPDSFEALVIGVNRLDTPKQ